MPVGIYAQVVGVQGEPCMPTASHLRNLKQALGTCRGALEEFESALLEFESALLELEETPDENGEAPKRSPNGHDPRPLQH